MTVQVSIEKLVLQCFDVDTETVLRLKRDDSAFSQTARNFFNLSFFHSKLCFLYLCLSVTHTHTLAHPRLYNRTHTPTHTHTQTHTHPIARTKMIQMFSEPWGERFI